MDSPRGTVNFNFNGQCPYLPGRLWFTCSFSADTIDGGVYSGMLSRGWRRCGLSFYRNLCPGCDRCLPLRVDAEAFAPSRIQRRVKKLNRDLEVKIEPLMFHESDFKLYQNYCAARHNPPAPQTETEFRAFLAVSPVESSRIVFRLNGETVGVAWTDFLPDSLSAVYFAFDTRFSARSPGVFSILTHIDLCRKLGKKWLHLGFHVPGCRKMSYKSLYRPCLSLSGGRWSEPEN